MSVSSCATVSHPTGRIGSQRDGDSQDSRQAGSGRVDVVMDEPGSHLPGPSAKAPSSTCTIRPSPAQHISSPAIVKGHSYFEKAVPRTTCDSVAHVPTGSGVTWVAAYHIIGVTFSFLMQQEYSLPLWKVIYLQDFG